jgi:hypothetical protein
MKTIKRKQPTYGMKFSLLMFNVRNRAGFIGKLRRIDEETAKAIPFTDFCDLRDKVKVMMKS